MEAFAGADAVLTALGVTATSREDSALLSANMAAVEESMLSAGVDRIVMINTLVETHPVGNGSEARRIEQRTGGITVDTIPQERPSPLLFRRAAS